jgi:long-chain fatty acid transport protein
MAGGVDNRSNVSGEYVRTLNRNAATDSLDAIAYNPAGVMTMEDGIQGNLSVHYVTKDYTNTVDGEALEQDDPSFVPALFALYKKDKWAGFFGFTIPAGGGEVTYDHGSATTRIGTTYLIDMLNYGYSLRGLPGDAFESTAAYERAKGESFYYGYTFGAAYKLDDIFSFSLAGRYISVENKKRAEFELTPTALGTIADAPVTTAVLDYKADADGFGFILGMNINYDKLNIGMRYETETSLDFKYDVNEDSITGLDFTLGDFMGIHDGQKLSRNLPAVLGLGAAYQFTPKLRVDLNYTIYFNENADWEGEENNVDNGWETGIAVEYIVNEKMKLSAGYLYTETGIDAVDTINEAPPLDANSYAAGLVYDVNDNLKIDGGIGIATYKSDSYTDMLTGLVIGLKKEVVMLSAGAQYRF